MVHENLGTELPVCRVSSLGFPKGKQQKWFCFYKFSQKYCVNRASIPGFGGRAYEYAIQKCRISCAECIEILNLPVSNGRRALVTKRRFRGYIYTREDMDHGCDNSKSPWHYRKKLRLTGVVIQFRTRRHMSYVPFTQDIVFDTARIYFWYRFT